MASAAAAVWIAIIGFVAFYQWLRHQRRVLIHRERLAALEKGVELPPLERETQRSTWNAQQFLLLAGLIWISLGAGAIVWLNALIGKDRRPWPRFQTACSGSAWRRWNRVLTPDRVFRGAQPGQVALQPSARARTRAHGRRARMSAGPFSASRIRVASAAANRSCDVRSATDARRRWGEPSSRRHRRGAGPRRDPLRGRPSGRQDGRPARVASTGCDRAPELDRNSRASST